MTLCFPFRSSSLKLLCSGVQCQGFILVNRLSNKLVNPGQFGDTAGKQIKMLSSGKRRKQKDIRCAVLWNILASRFASVFHLAKAFYELLSSRVLESGMNTDLF